ncbi:MAG TPA: hypothetical protein VNO82_20710 [Solirubrobacteraceae bacterium]|nr:hypothetical protein [Solirubrobacteraceae bacterium]
MRRKLSAAACTVAAGLLVVPAADAATWRGKTKQGRSVLVVTGADGLVSKARIRYRARCSDGMGFKAGVAFLPPLDRSSTSEFSDGGVIKWRIKGGERAKGRTFIRGGLRTSGRWTGRFRIRVRITEGGRHVATCRSGLVGWRASPA